MLETLRVQNYALIDDLEVDFCPGFNVLTGETGAGKSIVIGALNLVLGARAASDAVRDGSGRAKADAVFRIGKPSRRLSQLLREHEIELADGELMLSRTVSSDGRSRAYAGGTLVPVSVLSEIGDELVDLHGQHEHQSLLRVDRQLDILDGFAGSEIDAQAVSEIVEQLRRMERALLELQTDDRERARQIEFLRYELAEIDKAQLIPGEEEVLRARWNIITNAERIIESAQRAYVSLYEAEESAAVDDVGAAIRELAPLVEVDPRFASAVQQLQSVRESVDEISREIRHLTQHLEFDPGELDTLNQRLALISDLKRKYGETIDAILAYHAQAREKVNAFEQRDERLAKMQRERDELMASVMAAAKSLSSKRAAAAGKLEKKVTATLQELGMEGGLFEVRLTQTELTSSGVDQVSFHLAANKGEKPKPMRQVASGGEISRIMLALKAVCAGADKIPTLIFDEIDAGVGGTVARRVADKLRQLAKTHQTICITHLAQIAAEGDAHYYVSKTETKGRSVTTVHKVEKDKRVAELARLLDGSISSVSIEHARTLLRS